MADPGYTLKLQSQNYIEADMLDAAFEFWFNDNQHIRSPFPLYVREELRNKSCNRFLDWTMQLNDEAKKEINDEMLAEKLEEIIFESAIDMVKTEDERLTILYPFLPRLGDVIQVKDTPEDEAESIIVSRTIDVRGDEKFLKVELENTVSKKVWETEFELPA